jgi:hypothetical protein
MSKLIYCDHRSDPAGWARELGISREAVEVYLACESIDLHVDSFIWNRILRYDLRKRHGDGPFGARFLSMVDFPRVREARLSGAIWVITTNPLRSPEGRANAFAENVRSCGASSRRPDDFQVVRNVRDTAPRSPPANTPRSWESRAAMRSTATSMRST